MLTPIKSMLRPLTAEETKQVEEFILANPALTVNDTIAHFEPLFDTPITQTCVKIIAIRLIMKGKLLPQGAKDPAPPEEVKTEPTETWEEKELQAPACNDQ